MSAPACPASTMGSASTRSTTTNASAPQVSMQGSITSLDRTEWRKLIPAPRRAYTAPAKILRIIHLKVRISDSFCLNKMMFIIYAQQKPAYGIYSVLIVQCQCFLLKEYAFLIFIFIYIFLVHNLC